MWSRRAQSMSEDQLGDLTSSRKSARPVPPDVLEQSYSGRQIFESASLEPGARAWRQGRRARCPREDPRDPHEAAVIHHNRGSRERSVSLRKRLGRALRRALFLGLPAVAALVYIF